MENQHKNAKETNQIIGTMENSAATQIKCKFKVNESSDEEEFDYVKALQESRKKVKEVKQQICDLKSKIAGLKDYLLKQTTLNCELMRDYLQVMETISTVTVRYGEGIK